MAHVRLHRAGTFDDDCSMPAKESSCRLKRRNSSTFVARPTPKNALITTMSLLAKSGLDDQVQSNSTAARPSMAALTTTMILNCLTCSRKSLTESAFRMPIRHRVELAICLLLVEGDRNRTLPWRSWYTVRDLRKSYSSPRTPGGRCVPRARLDASMILRWLRLNTLLSRSDSQPVLPGRSC